MEEKDVICDECDAEFTILYHHILGIPTSCPWCGHDIQVTKTDDE